MKDKELRKSLEEGGFIMKGQVATTTGVYDKLIARRPYVGMQYDEKIYFERMIKKVEDKLDALAQASGYWYHPTSKVPARYTKIKYKK